jgi:uncharacterized protein YecE (DUF72 family)
MKSESKMLFGVAGWDYPDWNNIVYPLCVKDKLAYIAQYVDLVEINSTFYRVPSSASVKKWLSSGLAQNQNLLFSVKLHQNFTHNYTALTSNDMEQFVSILEPFYQHKRLFCILAQFKYDFIFSSETALHLQKLTKMFDATKMVFEFRHSSWQNEVALSFIKSLGANIANLDYPIGKESFNLPLCNAGSITYFRLHGRNKKAWFDKKAGRDETYNYFYNKEELEEIKGRIQTLAKSNKPLAIIGNNHFQGKALANILQLRSFITEQKINIPQNFLRHYPVLKPIALNKMMELNLN